jgi:hypothetical protein
MKNLIQVCEDLQDTISEKYDLGPGDAADFFKEIWAELAEGPHPAPLAKAITLVEETLL